MKKLSFFTAIVLLALIYLFLASEDSPLIFLTWENEDTAHTMTVNYISEHSAQAVNVYYDTTSQNGNPEHYSYKSQGVVRSYPDVNFSVHSTQLEQLTPDQTYYFIVGNKTTGYSSQRKFRTIPDTGTIRFISGGDTSVSKAFEKICLIAAQSKPHFAIIGGDLAYANSDINSQHLWLELFDIWQRTMITPDGYTIPVIAAIGNHEVDSTNQPPHKPPTESIADNAIFYHMIFHPAAEKTFFKRKIGNGTILFLLDTDHIYSSDGEQLEWMNKHFAKHENDNFRFASYHVPLYPSFRDPESFKNVQLRENWLNVFDQHHLDIAFENHEHTLKKSKLLRGNKVVDAQGTIYIGDGGWGRRTRLPVDRWYIESTRPINHVWEITLHEKTATFKALTIEGTDQDYTFSVTATEKPGKKSTTHAISN